MKIAAGAIFYNFIVQVDNDNKGISIYCLCNNKLW